MAVLPGQTGANVRQIVTGTASPFTLGAAVANYLTLAAIGGVASDTFYGTCEEVDASGNRNGVWVYGLWTIGSGTVTLTTALRNSAGGTTAPTFGAGTKHLYISDSPDLDILTFAADGEVLYRSGTTLDGATKVLVDPSDGNLLLADNTAAGCASEFAETDIPRAPRYSRS
jgi:hypothetical protein